MADTDDLIARSHDLDRRIEDSQSVINELLGYAAANRRVSRAAFCLAIILVVVAGVLTFALLRINDNAHHLARVDDLNAIVADNLRQSCESDNRARAGEVELWKAIFDIPPDHPLTDAEKEQRASVLAVINRVFAVVDCTVPVP